LNPLIVAPLLIPAVTGAVTLLFIRRRRPLGAWLSLASAVLLTGIALRLFLIADAGDIAVYALGGWPAPFGVVLVLDRLAGLMLLLTSLLALAVLGHAVVTGLDRKGWHFHPLFQFQLLGLNGAFLTGDFFNLFVFFEVLLIASYGLMLHGQGAERLKAGVQYVIVNLVGSTLFLIAVGILYGITGTLNMADMAARIPLLPEGDRGLLRAGALLLLAVFALKAALLPLHLWLPRTYAGASPVVAALFAIMTKLGVYAIVRTTTLTLGDGVNLADWLPLSWMLPCALATMAIGSLGVLAARNLRELAAFALLGSTAMLVTAIALFDRPGLAAGLYYLPHTTLAAALLFLVVDLVMRSRDDRADGLVAGSRFAGMERISLFYFLAGIAVVGLPPLSGFIGKLLILQASAGGAWTRWVWATILITTLINVFGLARAGSMIFWKSASVSPPTGEPPAARGPTVLELLPALALIGLLAALTIGAGAAIEFGDRLTEQLFAPAAYVDAVLRPAEGA
jgi:multicomponent K+:H+ antiporter subunit D